MSYPTSVGFEAAFGRAESLDSAEIAYTMEWIERAMNARWRACADSGGGHRWTATSTDVLLAKLSGYDGILDVRPRDVKHNPPWSISITPFSRRTATQVRVRWWVDGHVGDPPTIAPGWKLDRWLDDFRQLSAQLGAIVGFVGDDAPTRVYNVHVGAFRLDAFDRPPGYQWVSILSERHYQRLLEHRRIDEFPWYDVVCNEGPRGAVYWLRATRSPADLDPALLSKLRWFLSPLLPEPVWKAERRIYTGWQTLANEDLI